MKFPFGSSTSGKDRQTRKSYKRYFVVIGCLAVMAISIASMSINTSYSTKSITRIFGTNFASSSDYLFSQDRNEVSIPSNNSHTGEFGSGVDIALIKPTFTAAAYSYGGFYNFYRRHEYTPAGENVTADINMLKVQVYKAPDTYASASAYSMLSLLHKIKWITEASNMTTLSDQDVNDGKILRKDGNNGFDVVVLGHQEYVTQQEYDNLKQFVHNGGTMIILDGNVFYAQVSYDNATNTVALVKGHGWAFDGRSAWRSVLERWSSETKEWVGSNYLCNRCVITFRNNPFGYHHHEEQYVTNPKDIILLNYNATISNWKRAPSNAIVATYELNYGMGKVIALGIYSDDILHNGIFDRYLDSLVLKYGPHQKAD